MIRRMYEEDVSLRESQQSLDSEAEVNWLSDTQASLSFGISCPLGPRLLQPFFIPIGVIILIKNSKLIMLSNSQMLSRPKNSPIMPIIISAGLVTDIL